MIGIQTRALFVDAYRDLNARKMFWAVLILNVVVVAAFGTLGVKNNRLSILTWEFPLDLPMPLVIYKVIFSDVVVGRWLSWVATILALISTASIFPDFLAGGAIDLYLSKPIARWRIFFTKFVSGLLFVALQVTVFSVGSFLVLGKRAGLWEPGLFLAIPIVLVFFSYLFSICVLLGVLTRSTLAAFFLTLVAWFVIWGLHASDPFLAHLDQVYQNRAQKALTRLQRVDAEMAGLQAPTSRPATHPAAAGASWSSLSFWAPGLRLGQLKVERRQLEATAAQSHPPAWARTTQRIVFALDTLAPKTQETIGLLDRVLFKDADIKGMLNATPEAVPMRGWRGRVNRLLHASSLAWVLGSSLAFEAAVLALAGWQFCRRDY